MPILRASKESFVSEIAERMTKCSECLQAIAKGATVLRSRSKSGHNCKTICSESCRLDFDDRYYRTKAAKRGKNR